jgi:kinetochore protein Mis13/DSN1
MTTYHPTGDPSTALQLDESLLDPEEVKILQSLTDPGVGFASFRRQAQTRIQGIQSSVEFDVKGISAEGEAHLADSMHKLDQRVATASRKEDVVLSRAASRLKIRDEKEKRAAGTKEVPVVEVLRSLGRILPESG